MSTTITQHDPVWVYPKQDETLKSQIIKEFMIHPVTAQVLVSRGFDNLKDIHDFLYAQLPDLLSPKLLGDMNKAIKRIKKVLKDNERILIYADNDVDGMSGAALLVEFFTSIGITTHYYVPNRSNLEINPLIEACEFAKKNQCSLLITVDCGITAEKEIKKITSENIDVIVTDHHEPTHKLPHCVATLNPKLLNNTYPNRELTGVGVAFKLAHAITNELVTRKIIPPSKINLKSFLDLVALGTIADMGALKGENRILVRYGLKELKKGRRIGLQELLEVCGVQKSNICATDIASKVAPRLNSLGRIADPSKGVELLLAKDTETGQRLAQELDLNNSKRQKLERQMVAELDELILEDPNCLNDKAIILSSEKWLPGIVPLLTARVTKQFHRPCAIIALEGDLGKGSLRSISNFPLLEPLKELAPLFVNYGGHDFAAGVIIKKDQIPAFKKGLIDIANKTLADTDTVSQVHLDAAIHFSDLDFDLIESLELLEPYGNENPPPIFYSTAKQVWLPKVINKTHLKLFLEEEERFLEGMAIGMAARKKMISRKNLALEVAFTPQLNPQKNGLHLYIKDFKVANEA